MIRTVDLKGIMEISKLIKRSQNWIRGIEGLKPREVVILNQLPSHLENLNKYWDELNEELDSIVHSFYYEREKNDSVGDLLFAIACLSLGIHNNLSEVVELSTDPSGVNKSKISKTLAAQVRSAYETINKTHKINLVTCEELLHRLPKKLNSTSIIRKPKKGQLDRYKESGRAKLSSVQISISAGAKKFLEVENKKGIADWNLRIGKVTAQKALLEKIEAVLGINDDAAETSIEKLGYEIEMKRRRVATLRLETKSRKRIMQIANVDRHVQEMSESQLIDKFKMENRNFHQLIRKYFFVKLTSLFETNN